MKFEASVLENVASVLLDAVCRSESHIQCLLLALIDRKMTPFHEPIPEGSTVNRESAFIACLYWLDFETSASSNEWKLSRTRELQTSGIVEYAALSRSRDAICIASSKYVTFAADSLKPIVHEEEMGNSETKRRNFWGFHLVPIFTFLTIFIFFSDAIHKEYTWGQTFEDVCAVFTVSSDIKATDIHFVLEREKISLRIPERILLEGELFAPVNLDASTWTLMENRLKFNRDGHIKVSSIGPGFLRMS